MKKQKICIIGGSLTALTTAVSLSKLDCEIDLITGNDNKNLNSSRTIAISESNLDFLKRLNIFKSINQQLWPCSTIKLFTEKSDQYFKEIFKISPNRKNKKILYVLENSKISKILMEKINNTKSISIKKNQKISEIFNSGLLKSIKYNNKIYKYNLIILCTGSESNLTKSLFGNGTINHSYKETSITTILQHNTLKNDIARQIFLDDEILAFLPISNTLTSIVWSIKNNVMKNNKLLMKRKIKSYAEKFFENVSFKTKLENKNLNFLIRNKYYNDRILLFGDALHVVHPFVGQGFNMIIRDLSVLEKILLSKTNLGLDLGSSDILSEFSKEAKPRNFLYSVGIDLVKNSFSLKNEYYKDTRNLIMRSLNKSNFAKSIFFDIADKGLKF
tara:strand:+ start:3245 stop:4408 length:1164 start_codon:yes stop_codon:yes gene_type:complete